MLCVKKIKIKIVDNKKKIQLTNTIKHNKNTIIKNNIFENVKKLIIYYIATLGSIIVYCILYIVKKM